MPDPQAEARDEFSVPSASTENGDEETITVIPSAALSLSTILRAFRSLACLIPRTAKCVNLNWCEPHDRPAGLAAAAW